MSMIESQLKSFVQTQRTFEVKEHPEHHRLYHIELNNEALRRFIQENKGVSVQNLEYIPYMRLVLSNRLQEIFGRSFVQTVREILVDRQSGGFTLGMQGLTQDDEDYVKFATALTHLIGGVNFDNMTNTYYARFNVKHTDNSDSYLRQAYRLFTLHTDGTFVEEKTDWLLMMKFAEENAVGGESRLLHLDDWEDLDKFSNHPLATYRFEYKAPSSKNVTKTVYNQTFFEQNGKPCICFIDQFVYPDTLEQAEYLKSLSESMENSPATVELSLPVGDLVMINNTFWLHGRAAFQPNESLYRELMRQRGYFKKI